MLPHIAQNGWCFITLALQCDTVEFVLFCRLFTFGIALEFPQSQHTYLMISLSKYALIAKSSDPQISHSLGMIYSALPILFLLLIWLYLHNYSSVMQTAVHRHRPLLPSCCFLAAFLPEPAQAPSLAASFLLQTASTRSQRSAGKSGAAARAL